MKPFEHVDMVFKTEVNPICICFASNETYSYPLKVSIFSLLYNRDKERYYDILIMTKDMSDESRDAIVKLATDDRVSIRFVDMNRYDKLVDADIQGYVSIETNYRLFLASDMYEQYDKVIYLDCDVIVRADVSELYDIDVTGYPIAAVTEHVLKEKLYYKSPTFMDNKAYSITNYCKKIIGIDSIEEYFNAGVLLINVKELRKLMDFEAVIEILLAKRYYYNDQDVLNIVVGGRQLRLGLEWNYLNCLEYIRQNASSEQKNFFGDVYVDDPKLVHFVGFYKPWKDESVMMVDIFKEYCDLMKGDIK